MKPGHLNTGIRIALAITIIAATIAGTVMLYDATGGADRPHEPASPNHPGTPGTPTDDHSTSLTGTCYTQTTENGTTETVCP